MQEATSKSGLWIFPAASLEDFRGIEFTMNILREHEQYPEFVRNIEEFHADKVFNIYETREKRKRRNL